MKTPDFWLDDSWGYRLCSVVQSDISEDADKKWESLGGIDWVWNVPKWEKISVPGIGDDNTRRLFAYAIRASKLPQYVSIKREGGGHAIICYAVNENGTLSVADPNYPGVSGRSIVFDVAGKKYQPYSSAANAAEIKVGKGKLYDKIIYKGAWTIVPHDSLAKRWMELKAGTIGKYIFASYEVTVQNEKGEWVPLTEGYVTGSKMLKLGISPSQNRNVAVWRDGNELLLNNGQCELKPGNNLLGLYIHRKVGTIRQYIDFKYVNVVYSSLAIEPSPLEGEANKEYTFTAKPAAAVSKPRYEWAVDGAAQQAKGAQLNYTFKKEGAYSVTCKLYDDSTADKKLVGEAEAKATISAQQGNTPPFVRDCKYLSFVLNPKANCVHDQYKDDASKQNYDTMKPTKSVVFQKNIPITWSGVNFSGKYKGAPASVRYKMGNSSDFTLDCSFNGWVSPDGKTIRQLNMTMVYTRKDNAYVETWKYEFKDLPFTNTIEAEGNLIREFTVFSSNNPAAHGKFTATYKGPPESYGSLSGSEKMSSGTGTCLNGMWENYTIKGVGPIRFGLKVKTTELNGL